jgi:TonB-dependent receptor
LAGLINLSQSNRNIRDESVFSFSGYVPLTGTGAPAGAYYLADIRDTQINDNRVRTGLNASLQWRPAENVELQYDLLYSKQEIDRKRWWLALPLSASFSAYTNPVFSAANTLLAGSLTAPLQTNAETYTNSGDTLATGLTGAWRGERLKLTADASYSRSQQDGYQQFLRLTTKTSNLIGFDFRNVDIPQFNVPGNVNLTDPTQFNFTNYFDNRDTADSKESAVRFDGDYQLNGPISHLKFGIRTAQLDVAITKYQSQLSGPISAETVPDSYQIRTLDILSGATGYTPQSALYPVIFGGGKRFAYDVHGYAPGTFTPYILVPLASFDTVEKDTAYYIQADIDTNIAGVPLAGNVGVRQVKTDFTANGSIRVGSNPVAPLRVNKDYSETLPSLSLKATVSDKWLIRFGAAKVIARPNSADQNPGLNLATIAPFTATAGNAELDPFKATQYDLSAEYYFKPSSLLSLGLFKKDLQSFIIRRATTETYNVIDYLVTRPFNGADATIDGAELVYQDNFDILPAPFNGLGMVANISIINSDTGNRSARTGEKIPVPGLSKNNLNLVLYYEKDGYGVRIAYNRRDRFLDQLGAGGEPIFFDEADDLAVSGRIQLTPNYSIDAQISNLLDSPIRKYGTEEVATSSYALNGRTFSIALRGKF